MMEDGKTLTRPHRLWLSMLLASLASTRALVVLPDEALVCRVADASRIFKKTY